jgi:ferrous iron transport protein A
MFEFRRGRRTVPAKRAVRVPSLARHEAAEDLQAAPTLRQVAPGSRCRIVGLRARGPVRRKLTDLGLVPSAVVVVMRRTPLGDVTEIRLEGELISLTRDDAARIDVAFEA